MVAGAGPVADGGAAGATADSDEVEIFFAVDEDAPRERVLQAMAKLRAAGRSCDTDYAGRSLNGQIKYANRLEVRFTVIVRGADAILRERGERDVEITLDDLPEKLPA